MQQAVKKSATLDVSNQLVKQVMRKDLHMGYRRTKTIPIQSNSERCLVLR